MDRKEKPLSSRKQSSRTIKHKLRVVRAYLRRRMLSNTRFIAITGSCGKTSTTRFLGHILSAHGNCHIGIDGNTREPVILTLIRAKREHQFVVQETGSHKPGALAAMLPLYKPQVGVVTTVGRDHYSKFRTLENTAKEKGALPGILPPDGVAVLNADDEHVLAMVSRTKARVLTYGENPKADLVASDVRFAWPHGMAFTVSYQGVTEEVRTGLFGSIWMTSVLAALAGAVAVGCDLRSSIKTLETVKSFNRRMSVHRSPKGVWLINDTFKSPYWSIVPVMDSLTGIDAPRRTIVLGSFSDNPGTGSSKYRALARDALQYADRVVMVGKHAKYVMKLITRELEKRLIVLDTVEQVSKLLTDTAIEDEVVLVKANGLEHLERVVHSQFEKLDCWERECRLQMDCAVCERSGMKVSDVDQLSVPLPLE